MLHPFRFPRGEVGKEEKTKKRETCCAAIHPTSACCCVLPSERSCILRFRPGGEGLEREVHTPRSCIFFSIVLVFGEEDRRHGGEGLFIVIAFSIMPVVQNTAQAWSCS